MTTKTAPPLGHFRRVKCRACGIGMGGTRRDDVPDSAWVCPKCEEAERQAAQFARIRERLVKSGLY